MYSNGDVDAHLCAQDINQLRNWGTVIMAVGGYVTGDPVVTLVGVLIFNAAIFSFENSDGSIDIYVPYGSWHDYFSGMVYYYGSIADWFNFFPQGDPRYCFAQRQSDGSMWYTC